VSDDADASESGIVTKISPRSVADTVTRFMGLLSAKGVKLFAVIDQSAEARQAGLRLRDTTLVIFGNPAAGDTRDGRCAAGRARPAGSRCWSGTTPGRPRSPTTRPRPSPPAID